MIKVSVITPVYKVPLEYLRDCFNSLKSQTMLDCEFIIVSDGAPEAECNTCEKYVEKDSRFKFFKREHAGVSATRNYGIEQAQGEYIIFVDADDKIKPATCQITYDFAKQNNSDIVLFDYEPIGGNTYQRHNFRNQSTNTLPPSEINEILNETIELTNDKFVCAVSTMCKLAKRELFIQNKIRFPKGVVIAEDRPVSYLLFKKAHRISYLKECLYFYIIHPASSSNTFAPNILPQSLQYLYVIKSYNEGHSQILANTAINLYFASWEKCYLNKNNPDSFCKRVKNIFSVAHSKNFNNLIQSANINKLPPIIKQEAWLLQKKIAFPFFLHAIKAFLVLYFL